MAARIFDVKIHIETLKKKIHIETLRKKIHMETLKKNTENLYIIDALA